MFNRFPELRLNLPRPLVIGGMIVMVIAALGGFWKTHLEKRHSTGWPSTAGTLLESRIRQVNREDTNERGITHSTRHFELVLKYAYRVDGISYTGHRLRVTGNAFASEKNALETLRRYQSQQALEVFFDPKRPDYSVLEPG